MSDNPTLIPYIVVSDAAAAIDFYKAAFSAEEVARHAAPNCDKLMHVSLKINGGILMMSDDFSDSTGGKSQTPEVLGGSPVTFHLAVDSADSIWEQAVSAGAEVTMPLADQFWGDRYGQLKDPFGHRWSIGQHIVKRTDAEIEEAAKTAFAG
jgi:PhnB protein